ncbi:MAG TPA: ParA family protein [Stellaceae bacterium]|nr:ParA family protein [Stellaceae bacterium]
MAKRPGAKRRVIGVVSQKGGVGKSTLCQLIAREAAAQGRPTKILDFDTKQMSSTDWVRERLQRDIEPAVEAEPAKDVAKALKLNRDYGLVVLDGAPGSPKRTAALVPQCDLVVLPTGASRADLVPTLALARRIAAMDHAADGPLFALCRILTAAEAAEARAAIAAAGFAILDGELIERAAYRQAQNFGRSASETAFPTLNARARALARAILDRLG